MSKTALVTHHIIPLEGSQQTKFIFNDELHELPAKTALSTHHIETRNMLADLVAEHHSEDVEPKVLEEALIKPSRYKLKATRNSDMADDKDEVGSNLGKSNIAKTSIRNDSSTESLNQSMMPDVSRKEEPGVSPNGLDIAHSRAKPVFRLLKVDEKSRREPFVIKPKSQIEDTSNNMGSSSGTMKLPVNTPRHRGVDPIVLEKIRAKGKVFRYDSGGYAPPRKNVTLQNVTKLTANTTTEESSENNQDRNERIIKVNSDKVTNPEIKICNKQPEANLRSKEDLNGDVDSTAFHQRPLKNGHHKPLKFDFDVACMETTPRVFGKIESTTEIDQLPSPIEVDDQDRFCFDFGHQGQESSETSDYYDDEVHYAPLSLLDDDTNEQTAEYQGDYCYDADDDGENDNNNDIGYTIEDLYRETDTDSGIYPQQSDFGSIIFSTYEEDSEESFPVHVEPCNISFEGEMVLLEGRSCLIKERNKNVSKI